MAGELWIGGERLDWTREKFLSHRSLLKYGGKVDQKVFSSPVQSTWSSSVNVVEIVRPFASEVLKRFEICLNISKGQEKILHFSHKQHYWFRQRGLWSTSWSSHRGKMHTSYRLRDTLWKSSQSLLRRYLRHHSRFDQDTTTFLDLQVMDYGGGQPVQLTFNINRATFAAKSVRLLFSSTGLTPSYSSGRTSFLDSCARWKSNRVNWWLSWSNGVSSWSLPYLLDYSPEVLVSIRILNDRKNDYGCSRRMPKFGWLLANPTSKSTMQTNFHFDLLQ